MSPEEVDRTVRALRRFVDASSLGVCEAKKAFKMLFALDVWNFIASGTPLTGMRYSAYPNLPKPLELVDWLAEGSEPALHYFVIVESYLNENGSRRDRLLPATNSRLTVRVCSRSNRTT